MKKPQISRRDFLKLVGVSSLAYMLNSHESVAKATPYNLTPRLDLKTSQPPNILVVVFDAWSARNISLYGYHRKTTPVLEKLAQRAVVYHHHYSAGTFTSPGTASLLTGLYPWTHQAVQLLSQIIDQYAKHNIFQFLPNTYYRFAYTQNQYAYVQLHQFRRAIDALFKLSHMSLSSYLFDEKIFFENYYSASKAEQLILRAEHTPSVSLFLSLLDHIWLRLNYNQLKAQYQKEYPNGLVTYGAGDAATLVYRLENAIDWIVHQANTAPKPHFGYIHLLPPHDPYRPRAEFADLFWNDGWQAPEKPVFVHPPDASLEDIQEQRRLYDSYISHVDAEFGRLYQMLLDSGYLENTILVLTSDHGEIFERGTYGHQSPGLFEPLVHIPLLIFFPGQKTRVDIHTPTSAVDVVPTLLKLAGGDSPDSFEGVPLPLTPQQASQDREVYLVEAKLNRRFARFNQASFAIVQWPYKLTLYTGYENLENHIELYHLGNDPEEIENIFSENLAVAQEMKKTLLYRIPSALRPKI